VKTKWTIAIATNPYRAEQLQRLMAVLQPQVDKHAGQIEVLIFFNNFEWSLGYLRQALMDEARGEYLCHIDDDDMVPADYCDTILPLLDGVDYIGFRVDFYDNGQLMKPVYHSLRYPAWTEDEAGYYRGITHLNPLRTELARTSAYPVEVNIGEDAKWALGVRAQTEHFIDRPMYSYWHYAKKSVAYALATDGAGHKLDYNPAFPSPHDTPRPPQFKSQNIRLHPRSTHAHN
jgi:hypothetical protein